MCASKSNTFLPGMRAIFDKIENSMDKPFEGFHRQEGCRISSPYKYFGRQGIVVAVALDTDMEWKTVKTHLRMVRCFSIIGPYTDSDRDHIVAAQTKYSQIESIRYTINLAGYLRMFSNESSSNQRAC